MVVGAGCCLHWSTVPGVFRSFSPQSTWRGGTDVTNACAACDHSGGAGYPLRSPSLKASQMRLNDPFATIALEQLEAKRTVAN